MDQRTILGGKERGGGERLKVIARGGEKRGKTGGGRERRKRRRQMCDEAAGEGRASCRGLGVSTRSVHS